MQAPTLFEKQNWTSSCIHGWTLLHTDTHTLTALYLLHTDTRRTTKSRHEPAQMGRDATKTRSRHVRMSQDLLSMRKRCSYKSGLACSGPHTQTHTHSHTHKTALNAQDLLLQVRTCLLRLRLTSQGVVPGPLCLQVLMQPASRCIFAPI